MGVAWALAASLQYNTLGPSVAQNGTEEVSVYLPAVKTVSFRTAALRDKLPPPSSVTVMECEGAEQESDDAADGFSSSSEGSWNDIGAASEVAVQWILPFWVSAARSNPTEL